MWCLLHGSVNTRPRCNICNWATFSWVEYLHLQTLAKMVASGRYETCRNWRTWRQKSAA